MVHLCDISYSLKKVVLSYFYPQLHINYQHCVIFFAICVEQGATLCSCQENIMRQCSPFKSEEHFGSKRSKLPSARCRVTLKFSGLWGKGSFQRICNFPQVWDAGLWYSGMWLSWTPLAIKHPRIFEVLSQEVWEKCSSYATAWIPFLCCFSYVDLINPVFCVVRTFCLSACALYTYIQKHFLEQFAFFSTVIHRSLTTWMRKNYVNLWWWWWHQHQSRFHIIPVMIKIIWHRQQNEVLALSAKHLYPIFCSQILCVMWKNVQ